MRTDVYTKTVLTVLAAAFVVIALNPWIAPTHLRVASSEAEAQHAPPIESLWVPKDFGKVVGFTMGMILFEASDGTLRQFVGPGRWPLGGNPPGTVFVLRRR